MLRSTMPPRLCARRLSPRPPTVSTESSPDEARHRTNHRRSVTMPIKLSYITPLLAAAAAAAAIATTPTTAADAASIQPTAIATTPAAVDPTSLLCTSLGGSATQCQTPGNVQINDAPPPVHYKPPWNDRYGGDPIPPYPTS
jgi:hypothetical protein